ncbi:MAG: DNA topoisomerase 3 [Muribaculaceae bacterium]|nr:DNA topoisomerase 3 [Muribaculaceae bacterium]
MILCIAEKHKVAEAIARILGADRRCQGFYEGSGYRVTWTYGHLCTLKEPQDYCEAWRRWTLGSLPMLPPRFGIKIIDEEGVKRQFKVIETLAAEASEIINCGDAGQEGELIQRWVMQKAGVKCPVKRLWLSSMADQAIRKAFAAVESQEKYDNLYLAGLSRAIGDWILGMNATRLYTLKYSQPGTVLSIGRVQTPTLAMIVKRHFEIENFVPTDTFEVHTEYRGVDFTSTARFEKGEDAEALVARLVPEPLIVKNVTAKQGREGPLRLFDLTSLQVECNRRWGWTANDSLNTIQSLYEKKVTTYPRVDTTYLPDDVYSQIPDILRSMTPYADKTAPLLAHKLPKSKKVFDNSKITDHHAIIPTGESPAHLTGDEKLMYHLIAMRFIAAFYPDCIVRHTTVEAVVGDTPFKATGKVITDPGWRILFPKKYNDNPAGDDDSPELPPMTPGESGPHKPSVVKKTSQPPKLYDDGTLLRAMETAGRSIDDETLREAMKENGLGRPSTRAAIIETLFRRRYIERRRKSIVATQAGIDLINTINEELLKSPRLTGIWENKLRRISRGEYSASEFITELKAMIGKIVTDVLSDNTSRRIVTDVPSPVKGKTKTADKKAAPARKRAKAPKSLEEVQCPVCGKGHIIKGRTAYGCSLYAGGCSMRLPFSDCPADATPAAVARAAKKVSKS